MFQLISKFQSTKLQNKLSNNVNDNINNNNVCHKEPKNDCFVSVSQIPNKLNDIALPINPIVTLNVSSKQKEILPIYQNIKKTLNNPNLSNTVPCLSKSSSLSLSLSYSPPVTLRVSSVENSVTVNNISCQKYSYKRRKSDLSVWSTISSTNTTFSFNKWFSKFLDFIFYKIGLFVADYSKFILLIFCIISTIFSLKIPFTPQKDDIKTGYTPKNAQSHIETMLYEQFYRNSSNINNDKTDIDEPISVFVFVEAIDGGSMLRKSHLNETVFIMDELGTKFKLFNKSFYEFCSDFCYFNEPVRQFKNGILLSYRNYDQTSNNNKINYSQKNNVSEKESVIKETIYNNLNNQNRIRLTYPFISILNLNIDMSPHFFGVQHFDDNDKIDKNSINNEEIKLMQKQREEYGLNIKFLKLIVLQFRAERPSGVTKEDVAHWERKMRNYLMKDLKANYVKPYILSITIIGDEIVRTGMTLFPYISVGFVIMSIFSITTVYISAFFYNQWTFYKILVALWACICPLLATSSALGFLFWLNFRFGTILAVSPFLIMAIGVDDAYLMIHSWQRICAERVNTKFYFLPTNKINKKNLLNKNKLNEEKLNKSLRKRIAEVLVDVGPSITITSLTNMLAFIIGIFSSIPEIQLFCAGNATAIFFDYIYQIFMFTPIIALVGRHDLKTEKFKLEFDYYNKENQKKLHNVLKMTQIIKKTNRQKIETKITQFMAHYCQWLTNTFTTILVFLILCIYWLISLKGVINVDVKITPKKLFLSDSFINNINTLRDNYILPNYTPTSVFVNKVGNLTNPIRFQRIQQLIIDFETMSNSLEKKFTHFWLRDFEKYFEKISEEEESEEIFLEKNQISQNRKKKPTFSEKEIRKFLSWQEFKHWGGFMRFNKTTSSLEKFFVVVAFHGKDMVDWHCRSKILNKWRAIAKNYSDLEAWVWAEDAQFLDQIDTLMPATIQSSLATLFCMIIVCGIFMSNFFTVIVATLAIVSICIGVFGFLVLWSINLDPISMSTTIMSIGFSVDFPAHVTYQYYRSGLDNEISLKPEERIYQSLIAIGFPLMQCGFSTILFVLCLLFVDTYMSEVFVKTMVLVVALGLFHGLFVVPTFLCALSNIYKFMSSKNKNFQNVIKKCKNKVSFSLKNLIKSTKPVTKIRRQLSKKNIAKIYIEEPYTINVNKNYKFSS